MIEILLKNKKSFKAQHVSELIVSELDFHVMQFLDHNNADLRWLEESYELDFTIMKHQFSLFGK